MNAKRIRSQMLKIRPEKGNSTQLGGLKTSYNTVFVGSYVSPNPPIGTPQTLISLYDIPNLAETKRKFGKIINLT